MFFGLALGGLLTSVFSWVLEALARVGLAIRARNDSSGFVLSLDLGRSPLARDAREDFFARVDAVPAIATDETLAGRELREGLEAALRAAGGAASPSVLAAEAAVLAVTAEGSLAGGADDLGFGIGLVSSVPWDPRAAVEAVTAEGSLAETAEGLGLGAGFCGCSDGAL